MAKWKLTNKNLNKVLVGVKVKIETREKLEEISKETGQSISFIAAQCIEQSLNELEF